MRAFKHKNDNDDNTNNNSEIYSTLNSSALLISGMHWLQEIVAMVMKQKADYEPLAKEAYMMEFNTTEELNKLPSPRYHK